MKEIKILHVMKYVSVVNVIGILLMLLLRLDYPYNAEDINWTPLYIPFCYQIEPVFGLWTSYLVLIIPVLVMVALWQPGRKYKLFLRAMFRLEICKYVVVLILRAYWKFAGVQFILIDYICIASAVLMIFVLREALQELKKTYTVWGGFLFLCLAIIVPFIPLIQYNEGIPATNGNICIRVELDKPGIVADTMFRVVRYSPKYITMGFSIYDLEPADRARFTRKIATEGGSKLRLILNIYHMEAGKEALVYRDEINGHQNSKWAYSISFKNPNLEKGVYRAVLECLTPSNVYDGMNVGVIIQKKSNYWKFFK